MVTTYLQAHDDVGRLHCVIADCAIMFHDNIMIVYFFSTWYLARAVRLLHWLGL